MFELTQKTVLIFQPSDLTLSIPFFDELADHKNPANRGIVRHGGLDHMISNVPKKYKPPYPMHVYRYLEKKGDTKGEKPRSLIVFGVRNTFQNLGLPGWHSEYRYPLLCRPDEPISNWVYFGLIKYSSGRIAIERIRFNVKNGKPLVIVDTEAHNTDQIEYVICGQCLTWEGVITPLSLLSAVTYDQRHCYHLLWEAWQTKRWPKFAHHTAIHTELMETFMKLLCEPLTERAAAMSEIAARHALTVTDHYYHSSIGIRDNGELVLIMMHGSLNDIGYEHHRLGSRRALLLDNGGSVGCALWSKLRWEKEKWYWSPYHWQNDRWSSTEQNPEPKFIGQNSYFRPAGHAVLIAELESDPIAPPLGPRRPGDYAWSA